MWKDMDLPESLREYSTLVSCVKVTIRSLHVFINPFQLSIILVHTRVYTQLVVISHSFGPLQGR